MSNRVVDYSTGDFSSTAERTIERENTQKINNINKMYRLAKNKYKIITDKGFSKDSGKDLTFEDVKGLTLEQKLLSGYYRTEYSDTMSDRKSIMASVKPSL